MAKYLLENIRASYPDARYGIVVASRAGMIIDLLAAYPWIELIVANRKDPKSLVRLWKRFRRSDLVITQYAGKPGGRFSLASKFAARLLAKPGGLVGFADASKWNRFLYDLIVPLDIYRAPRLLECDALEALGIERKVPQATLAYIPQPELLPRLDLRKGDYVIVHLFAGSAGRGMSAGKRQALVDALARTFPDTPLVFTGSHSEHAFIEQLSLPANAQNVAGDLSVQELAALIDGCGSMVSIGTGPSHMASHLGKPLVVLVTCVGVHWCGADQFGDAGAVIFSDQEICRGAHDHKAPVPPCIENIDVSEVATAAAQQFREARSEVSPA
jgi:ADP-heptose:LPS heptosyltransferase